MAADLIRTFELQFIPGLLQTPDYARAVVQLGRQDKPLSRSEQERLVTLRMSRQEVLTRQRPARLWAVVDEAVLRRPIGSKAVLKGQTGVPDRGLPAAQRHAADHPVRQGRLHRDRRRVHAAAVQRQRPAGHRLHRALDQRASTSTSARNSTRTSSPWTRCPSRPPSPARPNASSARQSPSCSTTAGVVMVASAATSCRGVLADLDGWSRGVVGGGGGLGQAVGALNTLFRVQGPSLGSTASRL